MTQPLLVMVMGEFSTGKSTFLNAILGRELLVTSAVATTAVITKLSYGAQEEVIVYKNDGSQKSYRPEDFADITAEASAHEGKEFRHDDIAYVERKLPIPILKQIILIDSPGLNTLRANHIKATDSFIDQADAIIWLMNAVKAASQSEMEAMKKIEKRVKPIVLVNKIDLLDEEEEDGFEEIVESIQYKLKEHVTAVLPISAYWALNGTIRGDKSLLKESKIDEFYKALDEYILNDRLAYVIKRFLDQWKNIFNALPEMHVRCNSEIKKLLSSNYSEAMLLQRWLYTFGDAMAGLQQSLSAVQPYISEIKALDLAAHLLASLDLADQEFDCFGKKIFVGNDKLKHALNGDETAQQDMANGFRQSGERYKEIYWCILLAEKSSILAQERLADLFTIVNPEQGFYWRKKAAEQGISAQDEYELAEMYMRGIGTHTSVTDAQYWYEIAGKAGYMDAQYAVGRILDEGVAGNRSLAEAAKWYKKAAIQKCLPAQFRLAIMYDNGQGVSADAVEAAKWYALAAGQGRLSAMVRLARMYENGEGVEKNLQTAFHWYLTAANGGIVDIAEKLADMYDKGLGTPSSKEWAFFWLREAALNGSIPAYYEVARRYETGTGIGQDKWKARILYKKIVKQKKKARLQLYKMNMFDTVATVCVISICGAAIAGMAYFMW